MVLELLETQLFKLFMPYGYKSQHTPYFAPSLNVLSSRNVGRGIVNVSAIGMPQFEASNAKYRVKAD